MHTIFVGGIATDKFSMGSNEPLGTSSPPPEEATDNANSPIPSSSMAWTSLPPAMHLEAIGSGVGWLRMSSRPLAT
jgi:hypothetical protein